MAKPNQTQEFGSAIRNAAVDPFRFEDFLTAWNGFLDSSEANQSASQLEADAQEALIAIASDDSGPSAEVRRMLNSFPNPALVVRLDGTITGQNEAALTSMNVDPGDNVDALPIALMGGDDLSFRIKTSLDRSNSGGEVQFIRAVTDTDDRSLTLALVPAQSVRKQALLFVIDPRWKGRVENLLGQAFQLTEAESNVLTAFLDGQDMKDIAVTRQRSLATVRTQMQTIMSKAGVKTQAELMRNALALSQFQIDIDAVAVVAQHPHRKRLNILRPGGRSVEVILAGDFNGQLVTFIPDITLFGFTAKTEAHLAKNGICMASIARPGFGATDPTDDTDYEAAMAADIVALQDQLGHRSSVVMAQSTAVGYAFRLGGLIPDRIRKIVVLNTLPPVKYLQKKDMVSPWAGAILRGTKLSPTVLRLMVAAGLKAWKVMGSRRFTMMQLSHHPDDAAIATQPDYLAEMDDALLASTAQGLDQSMHDLRVSTRDWSDWAKACKVPVALFHGAQNTFAPIQAVEAFVADFQANMTLISEPDGGYMVAATHQDRLTELLLD